MAESETSSTRMGRFRICPPPNSPGPPNEQMSHGRFRIIPQGKRVQTYSNKKPNKNKCKTKWNRVVPKLCSHKDLDGISHRIEGFFSFWIISRTRSLKVIVVFTIYNRNWRIHEFFIGTYGPTSPCVQRGRFAVIPEEPSSSPSVNDSNTNERRRTPSPDWDFTTEVIITTIFQHRNIKYKTIFNPMLSDTYKKMKTILCTIVWNDK